VSWPAVALAETIELNPSGLAANSWLGVAQASMESINRYLACELQPHGIRSNLIARRTDPQCRP
jgi:NAD(P)-dependent dehydrogenase (short-subunit alcohol dehydrogenase family)